MKRLGAGAGHPLLVGMAAHFDTFAVRWAKTWMGTALASFRLDSAGRAAILEFRGREFRRRPDTM